MIKRCKQCGEEKTLVNFTRDKTTLDQKCPICRRCKSVNLAKKYGVPLEKVKKVNYELSVPYYMRPEIKEKKRLYQKSLRERLTEEQKEQKRNTTREWRERNPRPTIQANLFLALRRRPTNDPVTIDQLMQLWIKQEGRCAITGVPLTWRKGKVLGTSISMDRIDPEHGYTLSNVRFVCHAVNLFKGRMTDAEMLMIAKAIVARLEEKSSEPSWQPHIVHSEAA